MQPMNFRRTLYMILVIAGFTSCQKVIQVHLNDSASKNVIEANISDRPGPYLVTITRSVNFDQENVFPAVSAAVVVITDQTTSLADTLKETTPGHYETTTLTGMPGHKYQLYVSAAGQVYTASATMPLPVTLDSLYAEKSPFGRSNTIVPVYTDPVAKGNRYHFVEVVNDTLKNSIIIRDDNLINGRVVNSPLGGGRLNQGDIVVLSMECIDSAMYQYYYTLEQTKNQNSATPANPQTNISGGALGYFSVHTSSTKQLIVP
jgi:hypothetical protein